MKQLVLGFVLGLCAALFVWSFSTSEVHAQPQEGGDSGGVAGPATCTGDVTGDGIVNIFDLLAVLAHWGPCPCAGTVCNGNCVDLDFDDDHCGACNAPCAFGEVCNFGQCILQCPSGQLDCGGACVNPATDSNHCGCCSCACGSGTVCSGGNCVLSCSSGLTDCGGQCVDLASDTSHCGACANFCSQPLNSTAICVFGACGFLCNSGWGDCNGNPADGCETNLNSSISNCGTCGNMCPARPNATTVCASGVCGYSCHSGWGDCNGNPADGCETNLSSSITNCGMCGNVCSARPNATTFCSSGACGFTCNPGWGDCNGNPADGCEVNLTNNPNHCGACGNQCSLAAPNCVNSQCVP